MGTQLPLPKGAQPPPQFSAHICCGQTSGWIEVPLGSEVGLVSGHIVLDGDPLPSPNGLEPQILAYICCGQTVAHLSYC